MPFWKLDWGQLYRSLAKMKQQGWINLRSKSRARGPERRVYALTETGRRVFQEGLVKPTPDLREFLIKLYLAQSAGLSTLPLMCAQQRAFDNERVLRLNKLQNAQLEENIGRTMLAEAALRELDGYLSVINQWSDMIPSQQIRPAILANQLDNLV